MCPVLPTNTANRNITAQTSEPLRNEAAAPFQATQKVVGAVHDVTQAWSDAQDVMDKTNSKAMFNAEITRIQAQAALDENFRDSEKYNKEIDNAKSKSLESVRNAQVRNALMLEMDYDSQVAKIKIDADFKKKEMDNNRYQFANDLKLNEVKKATASDTERQSIDISIANDLNAQVLSGLISREDADKMIRAAQKSAAENLVYSNPALGRDIVKSGMYPYLTPEEIQKLIKDSYQIEKSNKELDKYIQEQRQLESSISLSNDLRNRSLTPDKVRELQDSGAIDSDTAAIFYTAAIGKEYPVPQATNLIEPDYFLRLIDDSQGDRETIDKALKGAAQAYADNELGANQYGYFIQEANKTIQRQAKGFFTKNSIIDNIKAGVNNILGIVSDKKNQNQAIETMMQGIGNKQDPTVDDVSSATLDALASQDIMYRSFIGKKPGDIVTLPDGVTVKYNGFTDGDVDIEVVK